MNKMAGGLIGISAFLAIEQAVAVVDQRLQAQGTNLVLSWPSPGGYLGLGI
jgi:hypothetical protein